VTSGLISVSEMFGGAESCNVPVTFEGSRQYDFSMLMGIEQSFRAYSVHP
jgi:hypothetical protein